VITFDSDLNAADQDLRRAFVGSDNREIGVHLAEKVQKLKPEGGTICIQSGTAGAANLNERMDGVRDTLGGFDNEGTEPPGRRLTGQNGWSDVSGCPVFSKDDPSLAVQQMEDVLTANADLDAFVPVGGWPQFAPQANRDALRPFKDGIANEELVIAIADTLEVQLEQLEEGFSNVNVGQRPFEMGFDAMNILYDIAQGNDVPEFTFTGLDVCYARNVDTCTEPPEALLGQ